MYIEELKNIIIKVQSHSLDNNPSSYTYYKEYPIKLLGDYDENKLYDWNGFILFTRNNEILVAIDGNLNILHKDEFTQYIYEIGEHKCLL